MVFDADTGKRLREVGGEGKALGRVQSPQRHRRVRRLRCSWSSATTTACRCCTLPDFKPLGSFGDKELRSPYGLWLTETEPGELEVYVTDSFMYGKKFDEVPPLAELDQRVRRYRVQFDQDGRLRSQLRRLVRRHQRGRRACAWSNRSPAIRATTAC